MPTVFRRASVVFGCAVGLMALVIGSSLADESPAPAASDTSVTAKPYPKGINCVWQPMLRHGYFNVIDDQHLVIEGSNRKYYLLTLTNRCFDLDTVEALAFTARGDNLCGPGDSVIVRGSHCSIQYLEEVTNSAEAKSIVDARKAAKKAEREAKKSKEQ